MQPGIRCLEIYAIAAKRLGHANLASDLRALEYWKSFKATTPKLNSPILIQVPLMRAHSIIMRVVDVCSPCKVPEMAMCGFEHDLLAGKENPCMKVFQAAQREA